jgi:MoxR-like ATPase
MIIDEQRVEHPLGTLEPAVSLEDVAFLRAAVQNVYVDDVLQRWLVELVRATRELEDVAMGASVRGSLALERASRAWALLHGRDYVIPADVERLFLPVISHRLVFRSTFLARARTTGWVAALEEFRGQCLEVAPVPGSEADPLFEGPQPVSAPDSP